MAVLDERLILRVQLLQPLRPVVGECELLAADIEKQNAALVLTTNHALLYAVGPRLSEKGQRGEGAALLA